MHSILDFGLSILLGSVLTIIAVQSGAANHIYNMVAIALEAKDEVAFMQILFSVICGFMHILLTIVVGRSAVPSIGRWCCLTTPAKGSVARLQREKFHSGLLYQLV